MNATQHFALCVRMSAIGDILMTARALYCLHSNGVTPVLLTSESFKEVPQCFPFLEHVLFVQESGKIAYMQRQVSGEFVESADVPASLVSSIRTIFDFQSTSRSKRALSVLKAQLAAQNQQLNSSFHAVKKRSLFRLKLVIKSHLKRQHAPAQPMIQSNFAHHSVVVRQVQLVHEWLQESYAYKTKALHQVQMSEPEPGVLFQANTNAFAALAELKAPFCVLFAGASFPLKTWPLENCADFISELERSHVRVVLIGGQAEQDFCERLARAHRNVTSLTGKLKLKETFQLIENATFVVTTDSFPAHVCDLLNKKAIVLFGATTPLFGFAPISKNIEVAYSNLTCSPCSRHGKGTCRFKNRACMKAHNGAAVATRVLEYFKNECISFIEESACLKSLR